MKKDKDAAKAKTPSNPTRTREVFLGSLGVLARSFSPYLSVR
jgi:hypothetical protein